MGGRAVGGRLPFQVNPAVENGPGRGESASGGFLLDETLTVRFIAGVAHCPLSPLFGPTSSSQGGVQAQRLSAGRAFGFMQ